MSKKLHLFLLLFLLFAVKTFAQKAKKQYIIDSSPADTAGLWGGMQHLARGMETQEIQINGKLPTEIAAETYRNLVLVEVIYAGFATKKYESRSNISFINKPYSAEMVHYLHKGVLVCHKDVAADLKQLFERFLQDEFPIYKVQPTNMFNFADDAADGWDDESIMRNNITTCFNFRLKTNRTALSLHAEGKAIDINPSVNPYEMYSERGKFTHPEGSIYVRNAEGAVNDANIVRYFDALGWQWAGRWTNPVDYQHFQKNKRSRKALLVGDVNMKHFFWTEDATEDVYFYENKRKKELNQPNFVIYKSEKPLLQRLFYALDEKNISILLQQKGKNRFDNLPDAIWDYQITDRTGRVFDKNTLLGVKDYAPIVEKSKNTNKILQNTRIVLAYSQLTKDAADILKIKLENAGAAVIYKGAEALKDADLKDSIFAFNPHFTLNLDAEKGQVSQNTAMPTKAKIYLQGCWKNGNYYDDTPKNKYPLDFARLLLTDDFDKSAAFAQTLNTHFAPDTVLPNLFRYYNTNDHIIQSDTPNIYYHFDKNLTGINGVCATVFAAPNAVASRFAEDCFASIVAYLK